MKVGAVLPGSTEQGVRKNVALEVARGVAAIVVVLHHFFLAFAPKYTGYLDIDRMPNSVVGEWYFAVFNGNGAVYFFFVLSGFVLGQSYLAKGDPALLAAAVLKRLPRLALPVILSLCFAVLLIRMGLYSYAETAVVTGSDWLRTAGYSHTPMGEAASFPDAIRQGLVTFFTGEASYNSNAWTMRPEFTGSIVVLSILPLLLFARNWWIFAAVAAILGAVGCFTYVYAVPFVLGAALSVALRRRNVIFGVPVVVAMLGAGLYLLGYVASMKSYAWLAAGDGMFQDATGPALAYNTVGALLVVAALSGFVASSNGWGTRISTALGQLSFPIYLAHFPILMSLSGTVFLWSLHSGAKDWFALDTTLAATLVAVLLVSIPLAVIDVHWVRLLNRLARRLGSAAGAAASERESARA